MNEDKRALLTRWHTNCRRSQIANYAAANSFSRRHYWLGVPTIVLTTFVGTSVFATLEQEKANLEFQILLGGLSAFAAVLAALQTFFGWGEQASKFRAAAAEYGTIKRQIDQLLVTVSDPDETHLASVREKMDTLSRDAPELPERIWRKARSVVPTADSESNNVMESDA